MKGITLTFGGRRYRLNPARYFEESPTMNLQQRLDRLEQATRDRPATDAQRAELCRVALEAGRQRLAALKALQEASDGR